MRQIGNTEPTAEVDDRDLRGLLDTELGDHVAQQPDHAVRGELEPCDVEDLRSDVTVQPDQTQMVGGEHPAHRVHGRSAGQRQPELLVFVRGRDELVRVGLDADRHANQHVLDDACGSGDRIESFDLGHRVEHDVPDPGLDGRGEFIDGFVVAVQRDPLGREVGVQRDGEFAATAHVERQPLLIDPASHLAAQECLRGVPHVVAPAEGRRDVTAPGPEVVLVHDEQWGAVLLGEPGHRHSRDGDDTVVSANGVARPHVRSQLQQLPRRLRTRGNAAVVNLVRVPRTGWVRVHIRSGALTPRIASPLAMTCRVAAHRASRAACRSPGCSSPCGSTRQES